MGWGFLVQNGLGQLPQDFDTGASLFVGCEKAAQWAFAAENPAGIDLVVDCRSAEQAPEPSRRPASGARWSRLDINRMLRGRIPMQEAVDQWNLVFAALGQGQKVLIHCVSGKHRTRSQYG